MGADYRQQQACEEERASFLWSSLNNLRGHISADLFQRAERELGFTNEPQVVTKKIDCTF